MAYVMHICFDNTRRLQRRRYLFEYRGVRFKLVQSNPRKWADHLLTIVPHNDPSARERAFTAASEFLSALAWQNQADIAVWEAGSMGCPDDFTVQNAEPSSWSFPRIPFRGNVIGYNLTQIPHIQEEDQRIALALFREACASNNDYLSFLFFWQVLEVKDRNPNNFIDKTFRKHRARLHLDQSYVDRLPLDSRTLGQYLLDDCRHAIAHIKRRPGKKKLDLDKADERMRLTISTRVLKSFSEYYIREVLRPMDKLYLARKKRSDFPLFVDHQTLIRAHLKLAYPALLRPNARAFVPPANFRR